MARKRATKAKPRRTSTKARKAAIFEAIKKRYAPEDLDEHVQEIFLLKATEINNGGMDAQLEFLAHESSLAWLVEAFLGDD